MKIKLFEVRDTATFLPVIAIKLNAQNEAERFLLSRAGYGRLPEVQNKYVLLADLNGSILTYDCFGWSNRTRHIAHQFILEHFDELEPGEVIDVQFILGETTEPKLSEATL